MEESLEDSYKELIDELHFNFRKILEHEDKESVHVQYRGQTPYNRRQDKGRIILGREEGEDLSYAYRLRFNNRPNEPQKISWFGARGFNNLSIIVGEKGHICEDLLESYQRHSDIVEDDSLDHINNLFTEIESKRQNIQSRYTLQDIKNKIEFCEKEFLQNIISPDRSSSVEIWKLLFSRDDSGKVVENEVTFLYIDDSTILAKTDRTYVGESKKKKYPFGLVIQEVNRKDRFFVQRIPRNENLESEESDWSKSALNRSMGFDIDYISEQKTTIPRDCRVRIQPNIIIKHSNYQNAFRKYRNSLFDEIKRTIHKNYGQFYRTEESLDVSSLPARITPDGLEIKDNCSTSQVKQIQSELLIKEEEVRRQQEIRDIGRLSSNLRSKIVTDIYMKKFCEWIFNLPKTQIKRYQRRYEDEKNKEFARYFTRRICGVNIQDELRLFVIEDPSELTERGVYNFCNYMTNKQFKQTKWNDIGRNNMVSIEGCVIHPYQNGLDGYERERINKVIVPNKTNLFVNEKTGNCRKFKLEKGVYTFKTLNQINTIRYS